MLNVVHKKIFLKRIELLISFAILLIYGCGTIVGNPKKPDETGSSSETSSYSIPEISFDLPEELLTEENSLQLTGSENSTLNLNAPVRRAFDGKRTLLTDWSVRFSKITRELNRLSGKINIIASKLSPDSEGKISFLQRNTNSKLSGIISPIESDDFDFQAVFCLGGVPFTHIRWQKEGNLVSYIRDFSVETEEANFSDRFKSELILRSVEENIEIETRVQGSSLKGILKPSQGNGIIESALAIKNSDGTISIRSVSDRYKESSSVSEFEGDVYIAGILTPLTDSGAKSGKFTTDFVGYLNGHRNCSSVFDEESDQLWDINALGPESNSWCIGRPSGSRSFETEEQLEQTLLKLKSIGIQKKENLKNIELDSSLTCPD